MSEHRRCDTPACDCGRCHDCGEAMPDRPVPDPVTPLTHSPQCVRIGGGPGHDRCICYCHGTQDMTVTVTKDQLVDALMANDDADLIGFRWSDAIFDDLLVATGHTHAAEKGARG